MANLASVYVTHPLISIILDFNIAKTTSDSQVAWQGITVTELPLDHGVVSRRQGHTGRGEDMLTLLRALDQILK